MLDLTHLDDELAFPEEVSPAHFAGMSSPRQDIPGILATLNYDRREMWQGAVRRSRLSREQPTLPIDTVTSLAAGLAGGGSVTVPGGLGEGARQPSSPSVAPISTPSRRERISAILLRDETIGLLETLTAARNAEDTHAAFVRFMLESDRNLHTFAALVVDDLVHVKDRCLQLTDFGRRFITRLASQTAD